MKEKENPIHPRNLHKGRYDLQKLSKVHPELAPFVFINEYGIETIDFFNAVAVKALNTSLLKSHYGIKFYDIPEGYLCPPIPGRADYIHHIADHLAKFNDHNIPTGKDIKILDIGMGANCIYPILGSTIYDWSFIGSDIDPLAVKSAKTIISKNKLESKIKIRQQINSNYFIKSILKPDEKFDMTICNPPFHASAEEVFKSTQRKNKNLGKSKVKGDNLNFGGQSHELWTVGGEQKFVKKYIAESSKYPNNFKWFSCLLSKESNLKPSYKTLEKYKAKDITTINMGQGHKISRIIVWRF